MPQDQTGLATYGNKEVCSQVDNFHHFFLDNEKQMIIEQWPILRQRFAEDAQDPRCLLQYTNVTSR